MLQPYGYWAQWHKNPSGLQKLNLTGTFVWLNRSSCHLPYWVVFFSLLLQLWMALEKYRQQSQCHRAYIWNWNTVLVLWILICNMDLNSIKNPGRSILLASHTSFGLIYWEQNCSIRSPFHRGLCRIRTASKLWQKCQLWHRIACQCCGKMEEGRKSLVPAQHFSFIDFEDFSVVLQWDPKVTQHISDTAANEVQVSWAPVHCSIHPPSKEAVFAKSCRKCPICLCFTPGMEC